MLDALVRMSEEEEFVLRSTLKESLQKKNKQLPLVETRSDSVAEAYLERGYVTPHEKRVEGEAARLMRKGAKYSAAVWQGMHCAEIDQRTIRLVRRVPPSSMGNLTDALFAGIGQYRHKELTHELIEEIDGYLLVARMITLGLEYQQETSVNARAGNINAEVRERFAELDEAYLRRKVELTQNFDELGLLLREAADKGYETLLRTAADIILARLGLETVPKPEPGDPLASEAPRAAIEERPIHDAGAAQVAPQYELAFS